MLVKRVKDLMYRNWTVRLVHVLREGNQAANALANLGHSLNLGVTYYCVVPSCILGVLQADGGGVVFPYLG